MRNTGVGYASRIVLSACIAALLFCLPYYCWGQSGETFGNIYTGLDALERLLSAMEERNATLLSSVTGLEQTLQTQEEVLGEQRRLTVRHEQALSALRQSWTEMSEAYKRQSASLATSERQLKSWKRGFWLGIAVAAGLGLTAGLLLGR
jgi:ElaB/YqjD/DUF883 family membrane-anchored ribosome-binding protein